MISWNGNNLLIHIRESYVEPVLLGNTEQNKTLLTNTTAAILHEWHKIKQYKHTIQCNKLFKDILLR